MLLSIFLLIFLPCVGMTVVFVVYVSLVWFSGCDEAPEPVKKPAKEGLSLAELEKLPKVAGNQLIHGNECAVCLDEIEDDQPARLVPGCNHGFHVECADTWLSQSPVCPICRTKLGPQFFDNSQNNPC